MIFYFILIKNKILVIIILIKYKKCVIINVRVKIMRVVAQPVNAPTTTILLI
jgi:hypothetical protein